MLQVDNFADVRRILTTVFPPPYHLKEAYSLERMNQLVELLGQPQNKLRVIHVAGTSGKTSTAYYSAALLKQAGKKVGLTVSPHIEQINERVQIGLEPLAEPTFCAYFSEYINLPGLTEIRPTYFELMIGFAYWVFAYKEAVDYAVIEVGVGGLGDSTNVISRTDKVCVITDIGMDHMQVLGDTIEKIAAQKAGIIKPHNPVLTLDQDPTILEVIKRVAAQNQTTVQVIEPAPTAATSDLPPFARRDWSLAEAVYQMLTKRDGLPNLTADQLKQTSHLVVPARMETLNVGGKTIVLDGSHNQQKLTALAAGLQQRFAGQPIAMMIGFVNSRADRVKSAVAAILPSVASTIVTSIDIKSTKQDVEHQSLDPQLVKTACMSAGAKEVTVIADPIKAFRALLARPEPVLLVTGSFYLLGQIRPLARQELGGKDD